MNLSNFIANEIIDMLSDTGETSFKRNDFAEQIGCAPSQINYVISSRFTPENGYIVESRRGGGGYIRVQRVELTGKDLIMHIVNSIGDRIDEQSARVFIKKVYDMNLIDSREAKMMMSVVNDNNFKSLDNEKRETIRAELLKRMLVQI